MIKIWINLLMIFCFISCKEKSSDFQKKLAQIKDTVITTPIKDSNFVEPLPIMSLDDSIHLEKVLDKLTRTKWFKIFKTKNKNKRVVIVTFPPKEGDSSHYWLQVGIDRPDRFIFAKQYATKKGVWKLLEQDYITEKLFLAKN